MSEKIPPDPVTVPPQDDDKKQATPTQRSEADPATWGADGRSPIEAMSGVGPDLKKDVKAVVGRLGEALKNSRKDESNYRPLVLDGEEPPMEPAPEAAARTGGLGDGVPVESAHVNTAGTASIDDGRFAYASAVVEKADTDTLKKALAEQMLKPAEMKRLWKSELASTVGKFAIENHIVDPTKEGPQNYQEFKESLALESRVAAKEQYAALLEADQKYADAYKRFYTNNNIVGRVIKRLRPLGAASMEINDTRMERDQKRLEAKAALESAARERWEALGKSPEWIERALSKYEGLHLYKDIIAPSTDRDISMRAEALGEKAPDALEKGIQWMNRANERLDNFFIERFGQKYGKAARVISSAILMSGGAAFIGSFGTAGIVAAAGFGTLSVFRSLGSTVAGLAAAETAGFLYKKLRGERAQKDAVVDEKSLQEEIRRMSKNKELTLEVLQAIERKRLQLRERGMDETLERKTAILKVLVGLGVGVSTAVALTEMQQTGDAIRAAESGPAGEPRTSDGVAGTDRTPEGTATVPQQPETPTTSLGAGEATSGAAEASAESIPSEARSLAVSGNINNADRLVGHFGLQLEEAFAGQEQPIAVKNFLELLRTEDGASLLAGEDNATLRLGLQLEDGRSVIMQPGDTITLNAENQIVLERPNSGLSSVLVESDGTLASSHSFPMEASAPSEVPSAVTSAEAAPIEIQQQPTEVPSVTAAEPSPEVPVQPEVPPAPLPEAAPIEIQQQPTEAPSVTAAEPSPEVPVQPEVLPDPALEAGPIDIPQEPVSPEPLAPQAEPSAAETQPEAPRPVQQEQPLPQPPAAEGPIDYTQPYTNINGVDIDPRQPAIFIDSRGDVVAYGGTTNERYEFAQAYALEHPGVRVLYDATVESVFGIQQPNIGAIVADAEGRVTPYSGLLNGDYFLAQGLSIPHPNDLVRAVPFTPSP
ncbi:MAG TPA: hypothetical protein VEA92_02155 [Candidatus Paceibacterota bacterium]|nr:hypothetical protein [Candidatus Paceibacterota bacterium]